jgi:hypothetical protein
VQLSFALPCRTSVSASFDRTKRTNTFVSQQYGYVIRQHHFKNNIPGYNVQIHNKANVSIPMTMIRIRAPLRAASIARPKSCASQWQLRFSSTKLVPEDGKSGESEKNEKHRSDPRLKDSGKVRLIEDDYAMVRDEYRT